MTELQLLLICNALKGSATKVLTAFMMAGTALDIEGLVKWTRMERHAISTALNQLRDYGLVVKQVLAHNRAIWMLATNVFPGMRKVDELGKGSELLQLEGNPPTGDPVVVVVVESEESQKNKSTTTNRFTQLEENPPTDDPATSELEILRRKNLATFQELGIMSSKSRKVAALEWVTPDYIRATVADAKQRPGIDNPEGFALTRMEDQAPMPEQQTHYRQLTVDRGKRGVEKISYGFDVDQEAADFTGHPRGCSCMDCAIIRTSGKDRLCPDCKRFNCECEESEDA